MGYWKDELALLGVKVLLAVGVVFGVYKLFVEPAVNALKTVLEAGFGVMGI